MYEIFELLLQRDGVTTADVSKSTGIKESTFSNWKTRRNLISPQNGLLIADFFDVSLDYLMTGKDVERLSSSGKKYYFNDETAELAQKLFEDSDTRMLFDAARDSKPENLQMAAELLKRLKGTNPDG